jgi:hypothetical protein
MKEAGPGTVICFALLLAGCGPPNVARRVISSGIPDAARPVDGESNDVAAETQMPPARPVQPEPTGPALDSSSLQEEDGGAPGPDGDSGAALDAAPGPDPGVPPEDAGVDTADVSAAADQAVEPPAPPDAALPPDVPPRAPEPIPPPTAACRPAPSPADLIADFESSQPVTVVLPGRGGTIWTVLDAVTNTGEIGVTSIVERCGSQLALRFDGSTFASRVPFVQAPFVDPDRNGPRFYDAGAYRGVRLALRSSAPIAIRINVSDRNTDPAGGICARCQDHFGASVVAAAEWQTFTVPFSSLRQEGTGDQFPALDFTRLSAVQIHAPRADGAFDLWIDDVSFVR